MAIPKANEIYRHFKGNLYKILTLAKHSETGEEMVVYQALYGDFQVYVRPLAMFFESVDRQKYPDAEQKLRFELVSGILGQENQKTASEDKTVTAASYTEALPAEETEEELKLDPLVLRFLDADSYEEKLDILNALHGRITGDIINTLAVAMDVEVPEGDVETRYQGLLGCLITLEKYECSRLR